MTFDCLLCRRRSDFTFSRRPGAATSWFVPCELFEPHSSSPHTASHRLQPHQLSAFQRDLNHFNMKAAKYHQWSLWWNGGHFKQPPPPHHLNAFQLFTSAFHDSFHHWLALDPDTPCHLQPFSLLPITPPRFISAFSFVSLCLTRDPGKFNFTPFIPGCGSIFFVWYLERVFVNSSSTKTWMKRVNEYWICLRSVHWDARVAPRLLDVREEIVCSHIRPWTLDKAHYFPQMFILSLSYIVKHAFRINSNCASFYTNTILAAAGKKQIKLPVNNVWIHLLKKFTLHQLLQNLGQGLSLSADQNWSKSGSDRVGTGWKISCKTRLFSQWLVKDKEARAAAVISTHWNISISGRLLVGR